MKIKLNKTISIVFGLGYGMILLLGWPKAADASEVLKEAVSSELIRIQSLKPAVSQTNSSTKASKSLNFSVRTASVRLADREKIKNNDIAIVRRTEDKKSREVSLTIDKKNLSTTLRAESPVTSNRAYGFSFYDAATYLNVDLDGDGFYSDFTIEFDADYDNGYADVYAVIYYSQNGGPWMELTVTDVFEIYLDDAGDYQSITSVLNFGFPSNEYDFLIDLYEDGVEGIVATIAPENDSDLFALPLEDLEHENESNQISISYVASTLFNDFDGDGFFTDLTLEYDIDTFYLDDVIYAEIVLTNTIDGLRQYLSTDDFILGNQTEFIDLTFNSGYYAGWYDVRINLINAYTGEIIASAGSEFLSLDALPIESVNNDNYYDVVTVPLPIVDVPMAAGALNWYMIFLGLTGLMMQRQLRSHRESIKSSL